MGSGTRLERTIAGAPEHLGCSMDDSAPERGRHHRGVCCLREGCDCSRLGATQPPSSQPHRIGGRHRRKSASKVRNVSSTDWKEDFRTSVLVLLVLLLSGLAGLFNRSHGPHEPQAGGVVLAGKIVPEPANKMALIPPPGKMNMLQPRDQALQRRHKPRESLPHLDAAWMFLAKAKQMGAAAVEKHKGVVHVNGIRVLKLGFAGLATGAIALALQMMGCVPRIRWVAAAMPAMTKFAMSRSARAWAAYDAALQAGGTTTLAVKTATNAFVMGTGDLLGQMIFPAARQAGKSPKALEGEKSNIERKMEGTSFGSLESPLDQSRFDAAASDDDDDDDDENENGNGQSQATAMPMTAARNARPLSLSKLKMKIKVDFKSVVKFVSVGALVSPIGHHWFNFLNTAIVGSDLRVGAARVTLDQLVFSPAMTAFVFCLLGVFEGRGMSSFTEALSRGVIWTGIMSSWKLWIPANLINFSFVPCRFQLLYSNLVGLAWNIYLSLLNRGKDVVDNIKSPKPVGSLGQVSPHAFAS